MFSCGILKGEVFGLEFLLEELYAKVVKSKIKTNISYENSIGADR